MRRRDIVETHGRGEIEDRVSEPGSSTVTRSFPAGWAIGACCFANPLSETEGKSSAILMGFAKFLHVSLTDT